MFAPGITAQRRRVSGGGSGGGDFSPITLPGLLGWFDASDESSLTVDTGTVSEWRNKNGGSNHASQATLGNRFTRSLAAVNGLSAMTANGSGNMGLTAPITLPTLAHYAFVVGGNKDASVGTVFLSGTSSTRYAIDLEASGVMMSSTAAGNIGISAIGSAAGDGSIHMMGMTQNSSGWTMHFDARTESGSSTGGLDITGISNYQTNPFHLDGTICEIIMGDAALTTTQINQVKTYLKTKWATP